MPCRDWEYHDNQMSANAAKDELRASEAMVSSLKKRNDELSAMLCGLCKKVEDDHYQKDLIGSVPGLNEWWEEHQMHDEQRRRKLKAEALAKLTDEEKQALGLALEKRA